MFACFLLCHPLPFRQLTCFPGAPRRGPQNRPFWLHAHHRTPKDIPRSPGESPRTPKQPPGVPKEHPWNPRGPPETTEAPLESSQGTPLDPKDHRKVFVSSLEPPPSLFPVPASLPPPPPSSLLSPAPLQIFANHFWPISLCTIPGDPYRWLPSTKQKKPMMCKNTSSERK